MLANEMEPKNHADTRQSVPSGTSKCTIDSKEKPVRIADCVISTVYLWMWNSSSSWRMPKADRFACASHTCFPVRSIPIHRYTGQRRPHSRREGSSVARGWSAPLSESGERDDHKRQRMYMLRPPSDAAAGVRGLLQRRVRNNAYRLVSGPNILACLPLPLCLVSVTIVHT